MNERGTEVLESYDLTVTKTSRVRGAVLCETNRGLKLLKECYSSAKRVDYEHRVLSQLERDGSICVDSYVLTRDEEVIARDQEGFKYTLRNWYNGRECDVKERQEILLAVRWLAWFHKLGRKSEVMAVARTSPVPRKNLIYLYDRHNRELKRARSYIHNRGKKTDFELCVIGSYDKFFEQASRAIRLLREWNLRLPQYLCHGDFNQHHVLIMKKGAAIVDFSHMSTGIQMEDLYLFMRKMMEKHNWNLQLGTSMLNAYTEILPFTEEEKRYLYILFLYPEKYWKQINFYYNANKAWIPARNVEKLKTLEEQFEVRDLFLKNFF